MNFTSVFYYRVLKFLKKEVSSAVCYKSISMFATSMYGRREFRPEQSIKGKMQLRYNSLIVGAKRKHHLLCWFSLVISPRPSAGGRKDWLDRSLPSLCLFFSQFDEYSYHVIFSFVALCSLLADSVIISIFMAFEKAQLFADRRAKSDMRSE